MGCMVHGAGGVGCVGYGICRVNFLEFVVGVEQSGV